MLRKLKELHQTCGILTDLYLEYSETYPDIDFRPINFNIAFSGEGQFEAFIDLKFNFDKETVFITYNDPYESHFDETYPIPMKLIGKPKNEIEKWYKEKIKTLKRKKRPTMKSIRMFNKSPFVIYHTEENHKRLKKTTTND